MENGKIREIRTLYKNPHLNFYHMDALTDSGREFDYFFASRNDEDHIKAKTGVIRAEGVVIYALLKEDPGKIVLIRQYRYPVGDYLYELPAGLIDADETPEKAAVREMREETGMRLSVCEDIDGMWKKPLYMAQGMSDEACSAVFGYAEGAMSRNLAEDTESITVTVADRKEVRRILRTEQVSLRMAYLMMIFLNADPSDPFAFLRENRD